MTNLTIIGDIAFETVLSTNFKYESVGGSAYYACIGAKATYNNFEVISSVGYDFDFNCFDKFKISYRGISIIENEKTAQFITKYIESSSLYGNRIFSSKLGALKSICYDNLFLALDSKIVYLTGSIPTKQIEWIKKLQEHGANSIIVIDVFEKYCQQLKKETLEVINLSDIVFMNEAEQKALEYNPLPGKISIIKRGCQGAIAYNEQLKITTCYPDITYKEIDSNGAGDILASSFLLKYLENNFDIFQSLKFAVNLASKSVSKIGVEHILF